MWSCGPLNATGLEDGLGCPQLRLALTALSLLCLAVGMPVGLGGNGLLVLVLVGERVAAMPDVYFLNLALAGLLLSALAPPHLLGPGAARWPLWRPGSQARVALLVLFNVAALVSVYSAALLGLDSYIARALPGSPLPSAYNARHVCGFLWGGALLTSFSALLAHVCGQLAARPAECARLQDSRLADGLLALVGYLVPALAALYALLLLARLRMRASSLDPDASRLDPTAQRLLLATVGLQLGLWAPHYLVLLGRVLLGARGELLLAQDAARCLAFASGAATPLLYRGLSPTFPHQLRRLLARLPLRRRPCDPEPPAVQPVLA
ncbi:probable G-protein coupled receptor 146 [Erinaceus europaeus]|uniref:Probable G-protein coupled receptor 146 n=1 Tax=Erinaceus europaeus TaxID=9365 RepID=A0A1S2ZV90_ERIEU|nr:probable G-protein coupled receptor 146 [Erinaceus europaeus]XP_060029172.1 probable G-protein coupled receptor 146 [Erinaceus europaeus]XP_060029173.1 probable G-protein coupled receptor 146 [Erinaceus europaeus]